jgi:hypothetical protein
MMIESITLRLMDCGPNIIPGDQKTVLSQLCLDIVFDNQPVTMRIGKSACRVTLL